MQPPDFRTLIIATLCYAGLTQGMTAQMADSAEVVESYPQVLVGITGGLHNVRHTSGYHIVHDPSIILYDLQNTTEWFAGLTSELRIDRNWSAALDISYNDLPGSGSRTVVNPPGYSAYLEDCPSPFRSGDPNTHYDTIIAFRSSVEYRSVSLALLGKWRTELCNSGLTIGINIGPTLHYITDRKLYQRMRLESPAAMCFIDSAFFEHITVDPITLLSLLTDVSQQRQVFSDDIPGSRAFRPGLRVGTDIEYPTPWYGLIISTSIFYDYALQSVTTSDQWYVHTISGKLSLIKSL